MENEKQVRHCSVSECAVYSPKTDTTGECLEKGLLVHSSAPCQYGFKKDSQNQSRSSPSLMDYYLYPDGKSKIIFPKGKIYDHFC